MAIDQRGRIRLSYLVMWCW